STEGADAAHRVEEAARRVADGEVGVPRGLHPLGDLVHRPVERLGLPVIGVRSAVEDLRDAVWVHGELEGVRPLRAKGSLVDGTVGVALDIDEPAALCIDELAAADGAVRADALGDRCSAEARRLRRGLAAVRLALGVDWSLEHWSPFRG